LDTSGHLLKKQQLLAEIRFHICENVQKSKQDMIKRVI